MIAAGESSKKNAIIIYYGSWHSAIKLTTLRCLHVGENLSRSVPEEIFGFKDGDPHVIQGLMPVP